jgi:peptidoglycan hydrolase-like protein with peptidoglycan-binding domain
VPAQSQVGQLPPVVPSKPTAGEIQTALKNAGYYTGLIDGKIGPLTKKAIEDFQRANNLQVDGKVGPKTWALLGSYLNAVPTPSTPSKKR